jgi:hypothetical protein
MGQEQVNSRCLDALMYVQCSKVLDGDDDYDDTAFKISHVSLLPSPCSTTQTQQLTKPDSIKQKDSLPRSAQNKTAQTKCH